MSRRSDKISITLKKAISDIIAIKLQSELNLKNKNYIKTDGILIENYMNQEMTIIRVNYDKKSY